MHISLLSSLNFHGILKDSRFASNKTWNSQCFERTTGEDVSLSDALEFVLVWGYVNDFGMEPANIIGLQYPDGRVIVYWEVIGHCHH